MFKNIIEKIVSKYVQAIIKNNIIAHETQLMALGTVLCNQQRGMVSDNLNDYEFKIFSQFGDDGIIQYLIRNLKIENNTFIEFGVENYTESNTRFLLMHNNWSGFVIDASQKNIDNIKNQYWFWRYNLKPFCAFIDIENINQILGQSGFSNIGILSIDIDGNDYHILKALDLSQLNPAIIIAEYNSVFGSERCISIPYQKEFIRSKAHYSQLYYGASIGALHYIALKKGYVLVGSNKAGNNAYFVRKDLINHHVKEASVTQIYRESQYRESRNANNSLSYLGGTERLNLIKGLNVLNVLSNELEQL